MYQKYVTAHMPKDIPFVGFQPLGDAPEYVTLAKIEWTPRIEYWTPPAAALAPGPSSFQAMRTQLRVIADPKGDIDKIDPEELQRYRQEISQKMSEEMEGQLMAGLWNDVSTYQTSYTDNSATTTYEFSYQTSEGSQVWHGADYPGTYGGTDTTTAQGGASITTSGDAVWSVWVNDHYEAIDPPAQYQHEVWGSWNDVVNETQEEREARERRAADVRDHMDERRREREAVDGIANAKADELLKAVLNDEQRADYDLNRSFVVVLKNTSYRLKKGRTGNVKELDRDGREIASYCIHPAMRCPNADTLVAQKFMLETDEAEFKRVANRTPVYM